MPCVLGRSRGRCMYTCTCIHTCTCIYFTSKLYYMGMGTGRGMVPTVLRHHYSCRLGLPCKLDEVKGTRLHVHM